MTDYQDNYVGGERLQADCFVSDTEILQDIQSPSVRMFIHSSFWTHDNRCGSGICLSVTSSHPPAPGQVTFSLWNGSYIEAVALPYSFKAWKRKQ